MMASPWAKAIAVIPGRPTPLPTTAAAPAPMNTKAKVPMNSARSFGAIRLDIVDSRGEIDRPARDQSRAGEQSVGFGDGRRHGSAPPAGEAGVVTPRRPSAV